MWNKTQRNIIIKAIIGVFAFLLVVFYLYCFSKTEMILSITLIFFSTTVLTLTLDLKGEGKDYKPLISFCFGTLSYALFQISIILSGPIRYIQYIALPIAGGFYMVFIGTILAHLRMVRSLQSAFVIVRLFSLVSIDFCFGAFLALYIAFIRQPLLRQIPFAVVGEWLSIVFGLSIIYVELKKVTFDFYPEPKLPEWQRHVQITRRNTNLDFDYLVSIQDLFINFGEKELLLVYYALQLREKGEKEREIMRKIRQLSEQYKEKKVPILAFPWVKNRIQKENKKSREALLKMLVEEINKGEKAIG